jgi:hypothetical protein
MFIKRHNWILTKKNAQLRVEEKKKKKEDSREHRTHANRRLKAHTQTPTGGGMREYNRSATSKKKPRSSVKLNQVN